MIVGLSVDPYLRESLVTRAKPANESTTAYHLSRYPHRVIIIQSTTHLPAINDPHLGRRMQFSNSIIRALMTRF